MRFVLDVVFRVCFIWSISSDWFLGYLCLAINNCCIHRTPVHLQLKNTVNFPWII